MLELLHKRVATLIGDIRSKLGPEILLASAARNPSDAGLLWMMDRLRERRSGGLLEIGTCYGVMAAVVALICKRVTTIDNASFMPGRPGAPGGRAAFARVPEVLAVAGARNVWAFLAKDEREKQQVVRRLRFDAAFIDGLHSADGVRADFEAVRRCGFVFFHNRTRGPISAFLAGLTGVEHCGDFALWRNPSG